MQTELGNLIRSLAANLEAQAQEGNLVGLVTGGIHAAMTAALRGLVMLAFVVLMLLLLAAVTYAQVIWAQIALAILIILGPIFIPFLVFDPLSFLFWGWFRAMVIYSLYAVMAGAVLRVFSAVGIAYITSLGNANLDMQSLMDVGLWMLAVMPLFVSGMLASLKCGELASMLVTSGGAAGSGLMGLATTGERRQSAAERRRRRSARAQLNERTRNPGQRRRGRIRRDLGRDPPHQPSSSGDLRWPGNRLAPAHRRRHSHRLGRSAPAHRREGG